MKKMTVISSGEELLHGAIVDTNSAFLSNELFQWNIDIIRHLTLGDNTQSLNQGLLYAINDSDIIIITGGLGPTDDDNTVEVLAALYNKTIITDNQSEIKMTTFFSQRGLTVHDYDRKMAFYPEGTRLIPNPLGLAPGFILEEKGVCIIALPGVPAEMQQMFHDTVLPFLKDKFHLVQRRLYTCKIAGVKESEINQAVQGIIFQEKGLSWGITTSYGLATITFDAGENNTFNFDALQLKLKNIFMDKMLKASSLYPQEEMIDSLIQKKMTVATAESCTGGLVAKKLTDIAGSSLAFMGGVTTYSNESKVTLLNVPALMIDNYGAVSESVAGAMAQGAQKLFNASVGISTTGIAGPGGGSLEKPVGTVCFGFAINNTLYTEKHHFPGDRNMVRQRSAAYAIDTIRKKIQIIQ